jgi:hypothetical protein
MNRNVSAWLLLVTAIAVHVLDEALTGFLPFYNQMVGDLRERLGFFPAPTFSLGVWLGGLVAAILLLFCMTPMVRCGGKFIRALATVLGILMIENALSHLGGSAFFGRVLPGMWSSPFLLVAAVWMVFQGLRGVWRPADPLESSGA